MRIIPFVSFVLLAGLFASCRTVKQASKDISLQAIDVGRFNLLKGGYNNQPKEDRLNNSYLSSYDVNTLTDVQLAKQFFLLATNWTIEADKVELLPNNNELRIIVFKQDKIVAEFNRKGSFRKGYFKTKKENKLKFPPIPPFYYFNENVRLFITIDKEGNLVIKRKGKKVGMIFFFGTGFKIDNEYRYALYGSATP